MRSSSIEEKYTKYIKEEISIDISYKWDDYKEVTEDIVGFNIGTTVFHYFQITKEMLPVTKFPNVISIHQFAFKFFTDFSSLKLPFEKYSEAFFSIGKKLYRFIINYLHFHFRKELIPVDSFSAIELKYIPFIREYNISIGFKTYKEFYSYFSLKMLKPYQNIINAFFKYQMESVVYKQDASLKEGSFQYILRSFQRVDDANTQNLRDILFTIYSIENPVEALEEKHQILLNAFKKYQPPVSHKNEKPIKQLVGYLDL